MTELLYLHDSYAKEFDAYVVDAEGNRVYLDRSHFYPSSGGQPSDKGKIFTTDKVYEVLEALYLYNRYTIIVDKPGIQKDSIVKCKLDWERRYFLMRVHTATHILSAIIYQNYSGRITGNQLDIDRSRIDFDAGITRELLPELEKSVNDEIKKGHEIEIKFVKRKDIQNVSELTRLAKGIPEDLEELRLVRIGDIDLQFDGGTHVKNTREIGVFKILDFENRGKKNKRIYFTVCGPDEKA